VPRFGRLLPAIRQPGPHLIVGQDVDNGWIAKHRHPHDMISTRSRAATEAGRRPTTPA
jgi:hypothetical protein